MQEKKCLKQDCSLDASLREHVLEPGEVSEGSISRITSIESPPFIVTTGQRGSMAGLQREEMELRLMLSPIAELRMMAMHSLASTYNQTGLKGVFRSFMDGL